MAYPFHNQVSLQGFHQEDFHLTMKISGLANETDSRKVVGKAAALDPTAPNTAKLAGDGDKIIGRFASFENRAIEGIVVGAVEFRFANTLPIKDGETVAVGDTVVGAGAGEVKKASTANHDSNFVAEINGTNAVVVRF
jgi:hypothetical protein